MKTILLAVALIATPAFAQNAPAPAPDAAPAAQSPESATPTGGYGPANTTIAVPPGATVVYQQAPTPDQAYPAPAPLAKYPPCKKGQFDKCIERGSPN